MNIFRDAMGLRPGSGEKKESSDLGERKGSLLVSGEAFDKLVAGTVLGRSLEKVPRYSEHWPHTRLLIKDLAKRGYFVSVGFKLNGTVIAKMVKCRENYRWEAEARGEEMAVCLVALKAFGVTEAKPPSPQMSLDT